MSDTGAENSYKSIFRGTSVLGGVQVFLVLVNLVRGKFVALLLGPEGMGISNLFNTSSATIQRFASLGLNLAIVREVAERKDWLSSAPSGAASSPSPPWPDASSVCCSPPGSAAYPLAQTTTPGSSCSSALRCTSPWPATA